MSESQAAPEQNLPARGGLLLFPSSQLTAPDPDETGFDYSSLPPDDESFVRERTVELHTLHRRTKADLVSIGRKLIEVKARLPHGQFRCWLGLEFAWSQDKAEKMMLAAKEFGDIPRIADFDDSALYVLAARSTPPEARHDAVALAESGGRITHKRAQEIVRKYRTPQVAVEQHTQQTRNSKQKTQYVGRLHELVNLLSKIQELDYAKVAAKVKPEDAEFAARRLSDSVPWLEKLIEALSQKQTQSTV